MTAPPGFSRRRPAGVEVEQGWEGPSARRPRRWRPALASVGAVVVLTLAASATSGGDSGNLVVEAAPSDAPAAEVVPPGDTVLPRGDAVPSSRWRPLPAAPLTGREDHTVAWTGREMLVWGGAPVPATIAAARQGAAYRPGTGAWRRLPAAPLPSAVGHTAVWTGAEMVVFGGRESDGRYLRRGAAYDPDADRWRTLADAPIAPRAGHVAVWTGTQMVVWGGAGPGVPADGAAYDPARDRWRRLAPAPLRDRFAATAVWTGREMMVWGGTSARLHDDEEMGAAYDPARDRWRRLPPAPLQGRAGHTAVWTGEEMLVYGGNALERTPGVFADGAAFDPVADRWRMLPPTALLQPRTGTSSVWTGEEMLVWGGAGERFHPDGAGYSPHHDRWRPLSAAPLSDAAGYPAVWTGGTMLVWGGRQDPSGAAYRPVIGLRLRRLNDPYPR